MDYALTIAPMVEPVTLAELKAHCVVSHSEDDTTLTVMGRAARRYLEEITGRSFITQTWQAYADKFPCGDQPIKLDRGRLQSVASVTYVDADGITQTMDPSVYQVVDGDYGYLCPAYGQSWPDTRSVPRALTVIFKAGYGDAADTVPEDLAHAIKLTVGHFYEQRETEVVGTIVSDLPTVGMLVDIYRLWPA
ncbi:head-tail connector protein [Magnetococcus sp. PR-3]|uniref:head-tail connector protein n=1 Tax=Magnetococcus sp. PR-3 TaxID=3120355 RepID=UPI002FCE68D9